jgi:DNA-binding transcriptional regulator YiaG
VAQSQAERRRRRKFFRNSTLTGRPDNTALRARLEKLADHISIAEISRRSGIPEGTVWHQLGDRSGMVHIPTLNALMGVRLTQADLEKLAAEELMTGAYRVVQGLAALGWTADTIGEACGLSSFMIRAMARTPKPAYLRQTGEATYRKLLLGAQKLERQDPVADGGIVAKVSKSTRARAARRGSAPLGCWDLDTVHDPAVQPEWTGACGTVQGYRIHQREGIPVCPACRASEDAGRTDARQGLIPNFSPAKLRVLREKKGLSKQGLSRLIGMDESTVFYWEAGRSSPSRRDKVDLLLSVLDATIEDLSESQEQT